MEHKLTFEWTDGSTCAADNMIRVFESKGIPWHRDSCFNLCAAIGPGSAFVPTEYYHIAGQTFGIVPRPVYTCDYFHVSNDELYQGRGHGYTKEDCMILDHTVINCPFCDSLLDALELADEYEKQGYETVDIVKRINNRYAVLARGLYR